MSRIAKLRAPSTSSSSGTSPSGRPLVNPSCGSMDGVKTTVQRPSKLETTGSSSKQAKGSSSISKMSQKLSRLGKTAAPTTTTNDSSTKGYYSSKDSSRKKSSGSSISPTSGTKLSSSSRIPGLTRMSAYSSSKPKSFWRKSDSAESNLDTSPEFDYAGGVYSKSSSKLVLSGYETATSDLFSSEAEMLSDAGGTEGARLSGSPSADSGCDTLGRGGGSEDMGKDNHPKIYTDWANHYLEKARYKRYITDLQVDVCDGVLLADVIQAVTNEKVQDINTKPRNSSQMVENISCCLTFLAELGVNVEGLSAKDIKDGNLKSILGLFFSLSRFKQQQKTLGETNASSGGGGGVSGGGGSGSRCNNSGSSGSSCQSRLLANGALRNNNNNLNASPNSTEMLSRLPSIKPSSKCPTIAHPNNRITRDRDGITSASLDRADRGHGHGQGHGSTDRRRSASCANNNNLQISGGSSGGRGSSREPSSRSVSPSVSSGIPLPGARTASIGRQSSGRLVKATSTSSCASTASSKSIPTRSTTPASSSSAAASSAAAAAAAANKNSMLDKFKFFNSKEKAKGGKASSSKSNASSKEKAVDRTAASGGSLAANARVASPVPHQQHPSTVDGAVAAVPVPSQGGSSPRLAIKGLAKKTFGKKKDGSSMPTSQAGSPSGAVPPPLPPKEEVGNNNISSQRRATSSMSSIPNRASSSTSVSSSASSTAPRSKHSKTDPSRSSKTGSLSSSKSASTSKLSKSAVASLQQANSGLPSPTSGTGIPKPGSRGSKSSSKEDANRNRLSASSKTSLSSTNLQDSLPSNGRHSSSAQGVTKSSMLQGRSAPSQSNQTNNQLSAPEARSSMSKSSRSSSAASQGHAVSPGDKVQNGSLGARTPTGSSGMVKGVKYTGMPRPTTPGQQQPGAGTGSREMSHSTSGQALSKSQLQHPKSSQSGKPKKVDSDTQTQMSAINPNPGLVKPVKLVQGKTHIQPLVPMGTGMRGPLPGQQQQHPQHQHQQQMASAIKVPEKVSKSKSAQNSAPSSKEHSNTSLNSDSNSTSNSTSNSNNSASSTDSVIFRPSSCDELESGMDSDTNSAPRSPRLPPQQRAAQGFVHPSSPHQGAVHAHKALPGSPRQGSAPGSPAPGSPGQGMNSPQKPSLPYTDHITQLRQSRGSQSPSGKSSRKMETTFDTEIRTEEKEVMQTPPRETTIGEDAENFDEDIKPMQPIMRSTPYSYLRGPSPLPRPSFHIPSLSTQNQHLAHSAQSRLGVNRPLIDPAKLYTHAMKRTISNCTSVLESDYSDSEGFDIAAGYMSDGDILRSNQPDDMCSGYMSEGGASLYARRMQQRFREGMLAVKECMQKSSGLVDDDSFDDSSSISSGDISDAIEHISTDENLTGSSLSGTSSDHTNPYSSLKRVPVHKDSPANLNTRSLPSRLLQGNKPPTSLLGKNLNFTGKDSVDASGFNWRKYAIGGGEQPVDPREGWTARERNDLKVLGFQTGMPTAAVVKKKTSQATITDLRQRMGRNAPTGFAYEDPKLRNLAEPSSSSKQRKQKKDSETNTDHSVMMMKKAQHGSRAGIPGAAFGFKRSGSGASTASGGSSKGPRTPESEAKGERLSNYRGVGLTCPPPPPGSTSGKSSSSGQSSSQGRGGQQVDVVAEYSASTLERRKKAAYLAAKNQAASQSSPEDHYHSLGRRKDGTIREKLFGSRGSLNKGECPGTIISNPHATFSKGQRKSAGEVSPTYGNNYLSPDYSPSRPLSSISSPTGSWLKANGMRTTMSETESMESISSTASSIQAQIQQAKALSLASRSILQRDGQSPSTGLPRSDSFKSTQSEKFFQSMTQSEELPRTNSWNQLSPDNGPSSPTPSHGSHSSSSRFTYPLSTPASSMGLGLGRNSHSPYSTMIVPLAKMSGSKEDDLHGSSLSLVSTSSSVYSTAEDKQQAENVKQMMCFTSDHRCRDTVQHCATAPIRKLKRELDSAQEKVSTLNTQLSTNAHVVSAFEQSLANMTQRLQHLTSSAEQKDEELNELRATIEALKNSSGISPNVHSFTPGMCRRRTSSTGGGCHTLPRETPGTPEPGRMLRQMSAESMSSINSLSSACSGISQMSSATDTDSAKKKKKKSWVGLRSSFSKAFSRKKNKQGSMSDVEPDTASLHSQLSVPNSPLLTVPHHPINSAPASPLKGSHSSGTFVSQNSICDPKDEAVLDLQQQLHEKDMKLTDIRLEALSSAHQLEQLREAMTRMKTEMVSLKADNSRLQNIVAKGSSPTSPNAPDGGLEKRLSLDDPSNLDLLLSETPGHNGQRVTVSIQLTDVSKMNESKPMKLLIGSINVSGRTKWEMLDSTVRRLFKEYVLRIDPVTNLGLNTDSVYCYHVTDHIVRTKGKDTSTPELLPCGYLVGDNTNITITLKGIEQNTVDALAFETLMPKSIVQRYISLLLEHRRIILCGPSGTGKTYLAQKLAEYLILKSGKELAPGVIATFNVDHKSSKELRQYLANIADQCESTTAGELPSVIILDNLHHVGSLGEVFNGFLNVKYQACPYIIGTMSQATCSTTNLQLHHNFRWVLCANHMEPVKGFLGRFLRRKLVEQEVKLGTRCNDLHKIMDWVARVWQHLNKFLETHSSSDVTIGPRLFLSCPMEIQGSQVWFTDLWNYSIVPYLLEAVREGIQLYGRRAPWEDPVDWVIENYPWVSQGETDWPSLLKLRPEDVGYDPQGAPAAPTTKSGPSAAQQSDVEGDPLMNMLMRLQEAASYSSPQSNDSDSTSLDSHCSGLHDSNANSGLESML